MGRYKRTAGDVVTTVDVLAHIAEELSSKRDWRERIQISLQLLGDIFTVDAIAAGIMAEDGWVLIKSPNTSVINAQRIYHHFLAFIGEQQQGEHIEYDCLCRDDFGTLALSDSKDFPSSFLSVPIPYDEKTVGVIHIYNSQKNVFPSESLNTLLVAASLIGPHLPLNPTDAEESRAILEALMKHAPAGIAIVNTSPFSIQAVSRRGLKMLGMPEMDASGITIKELNRNNSIWSLDGVTRASVKDTPVFRAGVLGESVANEEWSIRTTDGIELPILCNAGPIHDNNGQLTGGIVIWRDITDIKTAQRELEATYMREHRISEVLQQALLPPVSIKTPHYEIAAEYHSALREAEVGGDFYDVFDIGDGWLAMVMGDVSGKGLSAAVYTSMAKYMIRAYAHENAEPKSVMKRLNEALFGFMNDETFITVFYGLFDTNSNIFAYANAGHEPPVLCDASLGGTVMLEVTGPAMGMIRKVGYSQRVISVHPDNIMVIYTDGITDSRVDNDFFGVDGVSNVITRNIIRSAKTISSEIYKAAVHHANGRLGDDAALLVLKTKSAQKIAES